MTDVEDPVVRTGSAERLEFVAGPAAGQSEGVTAVVLDPAWTPAAGDPGAQIPIRALVGPVVEADDLFDEALARLDAWADASGAADSLLVEGWTYWFRLRETMWRWLHELLLWRRVLASFPSAGLPAELADVAIPEGEPLLAEAARLVWPSARVVVAAAAGSEPAVPGTAPDGSRIGRLTAGLGRLGRSRPEQPARADAPAAEPPARLLAERIERALAVRRPRVVVLTNPRTYQHVGSGGGRADPLFGAVIPRLADQGIQPLLVGPFLDHRVDADRQLLEAHPDVLPGTALGRWSAAEDRARGEAAAAAVMAASEALAGTPLAVDGVDVAPRLAETLARQAARISRRDVVMRARLERFLADVRPGAVILAQEGIHTAWLVASHSAGLPTFAVQHGVLYPGHPGYPNRSHPALPLPTHTFTYGDYERDILVGRGAYRPDMVTAVGSPRLDLDMLDGGGNRTPAERAAVRRELGLADGERLLVVSTVNLRFVQRSHFVHTLARTLGGPLPRVHIVFKQHPGEFERGPYEDLLLGLARAGGYDPPPIGVVKDIDLYLLLRAADAHLGALSTVLSEAVVAGTKNLISVVDGHADLLGYVEAGVATPVRSPADVLAALDDPRPPDRAARAAFLGRHFRPGDASGRIVEAVAAAVGAASRPS